MLGLLFLCHNHIHNSRHVWSCDFIVVAIQEKSEEISCLLRVSGDISVVFLEIYGNLGGKWADFRRLLRPICWGLKGWRNHLGFQRKLWVNTPGKHANTRSGERALARIPTSLSFHVYMYLFLIYEFYTDMQHPQCVKKNESLNISKYTCKAVWPKRRG